MLGNVEADVFLFFGDTKADRDVEQLQEGVASAAGDDHRDQYTERLDAELPESTTVEESGRTDACDVDQARRSEKSERERPDDTGDAMNRERAEWIIDIFRHEEACAVRSD